MTVINVFQPPPIKQALSKLGWGQLYGSSAALALIHTAQQHPAPLLVIAQDSQSADQLEHALRFFSRDVADTPAILNFPDWETLPYDHFSPHRDIISDRIRTLYQMSSLNKGIVIVPASTLMCRLPPTDYLLKHSLVLNRGQQINRDHFRHRLQDNGYHMVSQVMEHGECAIRGSIIDLYPMGSQAPYRIDLFGDEIDSIRLFDPDTQRSIKKVDAIELLPAHEFPLTDQAITLFRENWRSHFPGNPSHCPVYQDVSNGIAPAGIEYYLPFFFSENKTLFDYLRSETLIIRMENSQQAIEQFWDEINQRYEQLSHDLTRPLLKPAAVFVPPNELFAGCNAFSQVRLQQEILSEKAGQFNFTSQTPPQLPVNRKAKQPLQTLLDYLNKTTSRVLFCAESAGRCEALTTLLQGISIQPTVFTSWEQFLAGDAKIGMIQGWLTQGLCLSDPAITIIVENQLFAEQVMQRRRRKSQAADSAAIIRDLIELHIGSPVVHIEHGVGRYLGLQSLTINDIIGEFLILEYAAGDRIYLPATSLHLISRYTGIDSEQVSLHKLGGEQWNKAKKKAREQIHDVAVELLDIYAARKARSGFQYAPPEQQYETFATAFPFEETPDQEQTIEQVITDMTAKQPMDRLVCGDVGFGKTEVAMRAAFLATQSSKQVAILVPTTLLAGQHFENFQDRFSGFACNIDLLSRFRSPKEQRKTIADLKSGKVDIIIGTHKLLQKDIGFYNLGLLIIDEEHRFGVRQKEHLKKMRTEIDVLSLTATPIPRTLNISMASIRDISLISTPPAKRLSIKTFCQEKNNGLIREAILREIMRGGQVFYLHNSIDTIEHTAQQLEALVPEAKIAIAHGQMRERELEQIMADFYHLRFNVLVCTTIIENGIDIPTTNTIIIDRADRFGLAQLHQLRGRVGRSHHQAYAYLMTPDQNNISNDAKKRLDAIMSLSDLGAGFTLATHDLEIRGTGELLGEEQSGHIHAIGFNLYMDLLDRAVNALKSGEKFDLTLEKSIEINLNTSTIIPETYLPDVHTRLVFYKRIANASDQEALDELQVEMIDRFGLLPDTTKYLFRVTELKLQASTLGIKKIDVSQQGGRIEFSEKPNINPEKIIQLIQQQPQTYQLDAKQRLRFQQESNNPEERFQLIVNLLKQLS